MAGITLRAFMGRTIASPAKVAKLVQKVKSISTRPTPTEDEDTFSEGEEGGAELTLPTETTTADEWAAKEEEEGEPRAEMDYIARRVRQRQKDRGMAGLNRLSRAFLGDDGDIMLAKRKRPKAKSALQTSRRYAGRPSPPFHARSYKGRTKRGNDGRMWRSTRNRAGIYQWKRVSRK